MTWIDKITGRNPDTGKLYFRRVRVPKAPAVPEPPPSFEESTTFTLERPPGVEPKTTWIGIVGEKIDEKESKGEGEAE